MRSSRWIGACVSFIIVIVKLKDAIIQVDRCILERHDRNHEAQGCDHPGGSEHPSRSIDASMRLAIAVLCERVASDYPDAGSPSQKVSRCRLVMACTSERSATV